MMIGRSKRAVSETRASVSWNVERAPNSGKNCFGRTPREAGHRRVPAPPHIISGVICLSHICYSHIGTDTDRHDFPWNVLGRATGHGPFSATKLRLPALQKEIYSIFNNAN